MSTSERLNRHIHAPTPLTASKTCVCGSGEVASERSWPEVWVPTNAPLDDTHSSRTAHHSCPLGTRPTTTHWYHRMHSHVISELCPPPLQPRTLSSSRGVAALLQTQCQRRALQSVIARSDSRIVEPCRRHHGRHCAVISIGEGAGKVSIAGECELPKPKHTWSRRPHADARHRALTGSSVAAHSSLLNNTASSRACMQLNTYSEHFNQRCNPRSRAGTCTQMPVRNAARFVAQKTA